MFKILTAALGLSISFGLSACVPEPTTPETATSETAAPETTMPVSWISKFDQKMQLEQAGSKIPGMAVALVKDSSTVFSKGYGLRDVENNLSVDENTLFHIASTHKSMNAMLIATLVDDEVVAWDNPVTEYYPSFELGSAASTNSVTLSHLLSMSSGIPGTAEDLLTDDPTTDDVFLAAKQATLLGAPSTQFSYSNISASIAGYVGVIASVGSDQALFANYSNLLKSKVLEPIGMSNSTIYASVAQHSGNLSKTYSVATSGDITFVASSDEDGDVLAPSGALKSNVKDMALYLSTQLNQGVAPNNNRVVSAANLQKTKQPILDDYAMGWEQVTYNNTLVIMHTGGYDGFVSVLVLIPSYDIGLVLLVNSESGEELTENAHEMLVDILQDIED